MDIINSYKVDQKYYNCCGASEPEASKRSSSLIGAVGSQKVNFLASLWILVVRILHAQLFKNIPLHYHLCDGL